MEASAAGAGLTPISAKSPLPLTVVGWYRSSPIRGGIASWLRNVKAQDVPGSAKF